MDKLKQPTEKTPRKDLIFYCKCMYKEMVIQGNDTSGIPISIAKHLQNDCGLKTNVSTIYRWKDKYKWDLEVKLAVESGIDGDLNGDLTKLYQISTTLFFLSARKLEALSEKLSARDHINILKVCGDTITKIAGIEEKHRIEHEGGMDIALPEIVIKKVYMGDKQDEPTDKES